MSEKNTDNSALQTPAPIDMADGIPDRDAVVKRWKIAAMAIVYLAWTAFLVYCQIVGS